MTRCLQAAEELHAEVVGDGVAGNPDDGQDDDGGQDGVDGPVQHLHLRARRGVTHHDAIGVADGIAGHAAHAERKQEGDAGAEEEGETGDVKDGLENLGNGHGV